MLGHDAKQVQPETLSAHIVSTTPLQLGAADVSTASGVIVATLFVGSLGNYGGNRHMPSASVYRNKCQVGGTHMLAAIHNVILDHYFHTYFHRGMKHTIYRRPENYQIADVDWDPEIQVIDRGGDNIISRMPMCRHGSGKVDPMHKASAEQGAERVGIVR